MSFLHSPWLGAALSLLFFIHLIAVFALLKRRNDYVDLAWGPGFLIVAAGALWVKGADTASLRFWLLLTLVSLWMFRLTWHLGRRTLSHSSEDKRYAKWRAQWGSAWLVNSYFKVFLLQGVVLYLIALPILLVLAAPAIDLGSVAWLGIAIWLTGFIFESVADAQLVSFKRKPSNRGQVLNTGLWAWSRHPNYFGEVVMWWGIFLLALEVPGGIYAVISPLLISFAILKLSGVPLLEQQMENRPGYKAYRERTSAFIPWPPRTK